MMKKPFLVLTNGLLWFFVLSHITGWIIAWCQTIWIIKEIRRKIYEL
jgi:hypothetical protein